MKVLTFVLVLIGLTTFYSCEKETVVTTTEEPITVICVEAAAVDTVWVFYDETYCSDPWGVFNVVEQEKLNNIKNYLIDLNIEVLEIEISEENAPDDNFGCGNKSGFVIKCKINIEDLNQLIAEDFYQ